MRNVKLPNTTSQCWAKQNAACAGGRRCLGKHSIAQYWVKCERSRLRDLLWIARHLDVPLRENEQMLTGEHYVRAQAYQRACEQRFCTANRGRWAGQHVRAALDSVMNQYDVRIPTWLF